MQELVYDDLQKRAALLLENEARLLEQKLAAKKHITTELEAMRSEDKILILSAEEERMLRAFRAFRLNCKSGSVFNWQTRPDDAVIAAGDTGLIRDPQEVS